MTRAKMPGRNYLDQPFAHTEGAGGVINAKLYVAGGFEFLQDKAAATESGRLDVYDPASKVWSTARTMPTARHTTAGAVLNGRLYVLGGDDFTNTLATVEIYDPATDKWITGPSLPTGRSGVRTAVIGGILYAVGGSDRSRRTFDTVEALNPDGKWVTKSHLEKPLHGACVAVMNDILYVAGGLSPNAEVATFQAYNPAKLATNCPSPGVIITAITKSGATATVYFTTLPGSNQVLEYKNSFTDSVWNAILPAIVGNGSVTNKTDPNATVPKRFYRVHIQ